MSMHFTDRGSGGLAGQITEPIREALSQLLNRFRSPNEVEIRVLDCTPPGCDAGFTL